MMLQKGGRGLPPMWSLFPNFITLRLNFITLRISCSLLLSYDYNFYDPVNYSTSLITFPGHMAFIANNSPRVLTVNSLV